MAINPEGFGVSSQGFLEQTSAHQKPDGELTNSRLGFQSHLGCGISNHVKNRQIP